MHKYGKILTLGASRSENALVGNVIIQEKVDGSQFRWGINEDGTFQIGSRNTIIGHPDENKMFKEGVEHLLSVEALILDKFEPNTFFFGEYLQKPKHNVLRYERVPHNHIVLFDVVINGEWLGRKDLIVIADMLDINIIPQLYEGKVNLEQVKELLTTQSYLGREIIEGVVIKNFEQNLCLGGHVFPLFTKYVREAYKERHGKDWKVRSPKTTLMDWIQGFKTEARWGKAIQHLKDNNELENDPRDIGKLIQEVKKDIIEEETEYIKEYLFKKYIQDITRVSVQGLPEWYKEKLLNNLKEE